MYYDLKNVLIKKEYIQHKSGVYIEGCSQGSERKNFDKINILKTEYYEKGKLIRTELNKNY